MYMYGTSTYPMLNLHMKKNVNLKGLSHEIELGLTVGRCWFLNFLGAPMIL